MLCLLHGHSDLIIYLPFDKTVKRAIVFCENLQYHTQQSQSVEYIQSHFLETSIFPQKFGKFVSILSKLRDEVEEEPFGAGGLTYYTKAWDSCCTLPMSPHNFNYLNLVLLNLRSYLWPPCKTKVSYLKCQDPKLFKCFPHLYNPPTYL